MTKKIEEIGEKKVNSGKKNHSTKNKIIHNNKFCAKEIKKKNLQTTVTTIAATKQK